ncbi:MAG: sigma-70 family RNA polymerase sigma factor [Bacteroidales bacterium]|nr:sigma-70 family RNA polymerase sigma factor [Candidatus Colimorpha onthohippi]
MAVNRDNKLKTEKSQRDYALVCAARDNGDEQAYAKLMSYYKDTLYLMLLRMCGNADDADDMTMETFRKAFCQLELYVPTNAFSTWLFSIGANTFIDHVRKNRINTISIDSAKDDDESPSMIHRMPASTPNPEEAIISVQRAEQLREVVKQLSPKYRSVIELRYYQELSYEEMSERLNLPLGTIKVHLLRAKQLLADILRNIQDQI